MLAAVLLGGGQAVPAASAATGGACPGTTGVTVVVDFASLGGGVVIGCAPGAPASGLAALVKAGFPYVEVSTVPGFVCRIGGLPGPDTQNCSNTPPANAYWTYWHASRGGSWAYSQAGAGYVKPAQGSVEGWAFLSGTTLTAPSAAPPAAAQPTPKPTLQPTPKPTPKATATPRPTATPPAGSTAAPSASPVEIPTETATPSPEPSDSAVPSSPSPSASPAAAAPAPTALDPAPAADTTGSPVGTLVGGALILLVVGGGVLFARRGRTGT